MRISSNVKIIDIEIPKQNYKIIPFTVKQNEENTKLDDDDLLYMTVKSDHTDGDIKFQKSLENGIKYNENDKRYEIEINSEDTANLAMNGEYGYDITIVYSGNKPKQKVKGIFKVGISFYLKAVV